MQARTAGASRAVALATAKRPISPVKSTRPPTYSTWGRTRLQWEWRRDVSGHVCIGCVYRVCVQGV